MDWTTARLADDGPRLDVDSGADLIKRGAAKVQRRLGAADLRRLVSRYKAGATMVQLAAEFGCSRSTVQNHLKALGVARRRVRPTEDEIEQMVALYQEGASLASVGARLGFDATSVLKYLRLRGVETRDAWGQARA